MKKISRWIVLSGATGKKGCWWKGCRKNPKSFTIHLAATNNHWEEIFWWLLAKNFGMKVNADAFEKIAISLPVNILAKHKNQMQQLEALLLGQAMC